MSNNQNFNRNQFDPQSAIESLMETNIPLNIKGSLWTITTPKLQKEITDMIADTMSIPEIDQVFLWPVRGKSGQVEDFNMIAYFVCDQNGNGNITRLTQSRPGVSRNSKGNVSLMGAVYNKAQDGNYRISDHFKKKIGAIAILDDDDNIIVKADPDGDKRVAVVELDFWKVLSMVLAIDPDSNLDFEITDCQPCNNSNNCMDFILEIKKTITAAKKRSKKNINYESRNRRFFNGGRR